MFPRKSYFPGTGDYTHAGIHERWEVEAHKEAFRVLQATGDYWSLKQRQEFVDYYLRHTPYNYANERISCEVCQETISEALLSGKKPFEIPHEVRANLRRAACSFAPGLLKLPMLK